LATVVVKAHLIHRIHTGMAVST